MRLLMDPMSVLLNPRRASIVLCAMAFVIITMLCGWPDQPLTAGSIVASAVTTAVAVVGLAKAYRGPAINRWWRTKRYYWTTRRYLKH